MSLTRSPPALHSGRVLGEPGARQTWPTETPLQGHSTAEEQSSAQKLCRRLGTRLSAGEIANWGIQRCFSAKQALNYPTLNKWLPCSPKLPTQIELYFFIRVYSGCALAPALISPKSKINAQT